MSQSSAGSEWVERSVQLSGRGATRVRESAGPPGAPTLLLLHGLGATGLLNWRPAMEPLARHYRVVVMDHRGHGSGMQTRRPFRLADCADDAAALVDALALDRVIAVGYSMGGPIAQLLWKRHRERVAGLVLCATACRFARRDGRRLGFAVGPLLNTAGRVAPREWLRRRSHQWLSDFIENEQVRERVLSELKDSDPVSIGQAAAAIIRFDSSPWIGQVDVPTSVVLTEWDRRVQPESQRRMAARIPGAVVHSVAGDHSVCVTAPQRFVPALLEACDSVATRASAAARAG